jgi:hypothetical protein
MFIQKFSDICEFITKLRVRDCSPEQNSDSHFRLHSLVKEMEGCMSWTPTLSAETETEKNKRKEKSMIGAAIVELESSESEKNIFVGFGENEVS